MPMPAYMRRYSFRIIGFGLVYAALLVGAITVMKQPWAPSGIGAWPIAILPALPIVGMIWTIGRLIVEADDEYQRLLFVKQTLLATGLTLAIATIWGFLENFDLVVDVPGYHVTVVWFAMIGISAPIVRWRA